MDNQENSEEITFNDELDLHHFAPADTKYLVEFFINDAFLRGIQKVKIIHGKGRSVKKREIYSILSSHPHVLSFHNDDYNWGATIVHLSKDFIVFEK
jgi:DNA mismatch repair protein MutS2